MESMKPSRLGNDRTSIQRPENRYSQYHAHVYFHEATVEQARELCQTAASLFGVVMGRVHQKPVGPHPHWSCQLSFDSTQFERLIPWLDAHRGGLNVLVHPRTGNSLADHTTHASWLGDPSELNLSALNA
jgi:aromatic ring-cleaving dioxygenase